MAKYSVVSFNYNAPDVAESIKDIIEQTTNLPEDPYSGALLVAIQK